ncbi:MAG: acyl-CoA dehydrogenase family protein [Gemmatirosa sp.]
MTAAEPLPHLDWPFFDAHHRTLGHALREWATQALADEAPHGHDDVGAATRGLVTRLGEAGWLRLVVPAAQGGTFPTLDVRALCLARETLARADALADFAFAMQGLGGGPIALFGSDELRARYLPPIADGRAVAAFALSETNAGSDVTAMTTTLRRDGDALVLDGEKTWISNAGIADHYVVFAREPEAGEKAFAAVVVDADAPGFAVTRRIDVTAPHPLGTITFDGCRVPVAQRIGEPGRGLRVALGMARRALDEALAHARRRQVFGKALAEWQLTQARLAEMALAIDASALLVYRAAWTRDAGAERVTREAAMAKLHATEAAQRVVDDAVQLLGGQGVAVGGVVERLYREVRALRIYEGTSEIQRLVIAGELLKATP